MAEIIESKVELLIKCDCGQEFPEVADVEANETLEPICPECEAHTIIVVNIDLEE